MSDYIHLQQVGRRYSEGMLERNGEGGNGKTQSNASAAYEGAGKERCSTCEDGGPPGGGLNLKVWGAVKTGPLCKFTRPRTLIYFVTPPGFPYFRGPAWLSVN